MGKIDSMKLIKIVKRKYVLLQTEGMNIMNIQRKIEEKIRATPDERIKHSVNERNSLAKN